MNEPTIWSNARIATCDALSTEFVPGALVTRGRHIEWVGAQDSLPEAYRAMPRRDLRGKWVTPGLIDCHTHLVFASNRAAEWNRLLNGASYEEIARSGGGIMSTVVATRRASEAELFDQAAARLECLLREGVTALEIKSGYGLTLADERKMLRVARALAEHYAVAIRTTLLAAHTVPPEFSRRADEYVETIVDSWLPALHEEGLIDAVDVFCERIAFDIAQSDKLLTAARSLGVPTRMHAAQLSNNGACQLASRHRCLSCDHLEYATEEDVRQLAAAGTTVVLLPTAFLHLREKQLPPVDALRRHGVPIAVASDCNPGSSPSPSLQLAAALAARLFGLTPAETLAGVTRNAARACGEDARRGTVAPGYCADFVVWDVESLDEIPYWLGFNRCAAVVRSGVQVAGLKPGLQSTAQPPL
jgi:imidazolonepropionase